MAYVVQADLVRVAGDAAVVRLFDANGDGAAEAELVAEACESASAVADAYLLEGWPGTEQLTELMRDELLRRHTCWIAMHFGAQKKGEWRDASGNAPYRQEYVDAVKHFEKLAAAKARSRRESTAGGNLMARGRVNRGCPTFVFAASTRDPKGPGGF